MFPNILSGIFVGIAIGISLDLGYKTGLYFSTGTLSNESPFFFLGFRSGVIGAIALTFKILGENLEKMVKSDQGKIEEFKASYLERIEWKADLAKKRILKVQQTFSTLTVLIGVLTGMTARVMSPGTDLLTTQVTISSIFFSIFLLPSAIFISGLNRAEIRFSRQPNQGIKNILKTSFVFLLGLGLVQSLLSGLGGWLIFKYFISDQLALDAFWSLSLLTFSFVLSFSYFFWGGQYVIQHYVIRILSWKASVSPWDYAAFLDVCTSRRLLQRVGGRYRFIHRLVQDHFAAMPLDQGKGVDG